jgi:hypothetical protein
MAATLASALESRRCELTSLNLAENHIDDRGAARLAAALVNNGGTLEELLLRDNGISSGGAAALAGALSAPGCALRMLDLSSNADIGCDAALTLAAALSAAPPPPLRTLLLSGCCAMGDAGTRVLGDALPRCRQLQQLSLASCGVTDVGAVALALGLRNNTSLLRLELCGNPIGDDGATALADALEHNTTLTALDLFDTDMAERGALALARALARAPALEALRLDLTMLSDEAQREQVTELAGMRLQTSGARGPRRWRLQDGPPWRPGELGWLIEDRKLIVPDLKAIYRAENAEAAKDRLADFEAKWGTRYPAVGQSWRRAWEQVIPLFAFPPDIRKMIYTTNAVESLNRSLRKIIKTRSRFPNDEAALKLLYLAIDNAGVHWRRPVAWTAAMGQFAVLFGDRFVLSAS